jgi:hypothetical protein
MTTAQAMRQIHEELSELFATIRATSRERMRADGLDEAVIAGADAEMASNHCSAIADSLDRIRDVIQAGGVVVDG